MKKQPSNMQIEKKSRQNICVSGRRFLRSDMDTAWTMGPNMSLKALLRKIPSRNEEGEFIDVLSAPKRRGRPC